MHRILALVVSAYWTAFFALLAFAATGDAAAGAEAGHPLWISAIQAQLSRGAGTALATLLAIAFATTASLFLWSFVQNAIRGAGGERDADDLARLAFGAGIGVMIGLLVLGRIFPGDGLTASVSTQFVALLASYLAMRMEMQRPAAADAERAAGAARLMALHAAGNTMLSRLGGRRAASNGEAR